MWNRECQRLIAQYMSDLGAEVNHHSFQGPSNSFHPLHFFSSPDPGVIHGKFNYSIYGINTIGVIRAPRGDGKEAIVLVTPFNSAKIDGAEAMSIGVAYSVFSLLSRVTWLAKDIIWLAADSQLGEYTAVHAWLREYHAPVFNEFRYIADESSGRNSLFSRIVEKHDAERKITDDFRRAGTMAAALVIKVADKPNSPDDTLTIYAEASNGQMPNLDLINVVNYLAVHKQGFHVKVDKLLSLLDSKWLRLIADFYEFAGKVARNLNPQWRFGIPALDYIEGTATLASSLYTQALGIPTGPHGAFRDYQVDAITVEFAPRFLKNKARRTEFLTRAGRLIEGVIRSVNNLLEKFHQSFFLYFLTSSGKFVSVGVYMIAFGLLVAPLPVAAASLHAGYDKIGVYRRRIEKVPSSASEHDHTQISWRWLYAARLVCIMHMWGVAVSLLPYFIDQMPHSTPLISIIIWALLSG
uniref:Glycosylphosphatidylinositol anchor attachment 1 protein n=1 Tax=Kalanchoe fedtschenkoi TaxID=63787 RepID=A0A7N0V9G4_KALFE